MTRAEREQFLAGLHVAVLGVDEPGSAPLAVPVWYAYTPGGTVDVVTGGQSVKGRLLRAAGRFSLCVQSESVPYRYVSVEGPITATEDSVTLGERRALAQRYLGAEDGDLYVASTEDQAAGSVVFRMTPERWRTADYGKLG
jgi:PPOX class probable F420-dependent enzyme